MVSAELGVGTLQGGVSGGLRLLDAVKCQSVDVVVVGKIFDSNTDPLRWAFFHWLAWDEFFDSVNCLLVHHIIGLVVSNGAITYWPFLLIEFVVLYCETD